MVSMFIISDQHDGNQRESVVLLQTDWLCCTYYLISKNNRCENRFLLIGIDFNLLFIYYDLQESQQWKTLFSWAPASVCCADSMLSMTKNPMEKCCLLWNSLRFVDHILWSTRLSWWTNVVFHWLSFMLQFITSERQDWTRWTKRGP